MTNSKPDPQGSGFIFANICVWSGDSMAVNITCPKCQTEILISQAFQGTQIPCPKCSATLILELTTITDSVPQNRRFLIPPISLVEQNSSLQEQAVAHLGNWLDVPTTQIKQALELLKDTKAYTLWQIPKGDGKSFRQISAPHNILKGIQRRILDRLLYRVPVSNASHGFVPGRSIVTNANFHLQTAQAVFNMDLKDAFPSVSKTRVKQLCVRYLKVPLQNLGEAVDHNVLDTVIDILVDLVTYNGSLPQGCPCSGSLLNIACITLDKNIYRLVQKRMQDNPGEICRYTRYADDITISSNRPIPEDFRQRLQSVIGELGFQVNPSKCRYHSKEKGKSLEVTGLILEGGQVRIPPKVLESYRAAIHKIASLPKEQITEEQRLYVRSLVAFVKMVYPKIPGRIWKPYSAYMKTIGVQFFSKDTKSLDLYPRAAPNDTSSPEE